MIWLMYLLKLLEAIINLDFVVIQLHENEFK
jgi:hypothetical protein